jgi:hypothetical protein
VGERDWKAGTFADATGCVAIGRGSGRRLIRTSSRSMCPMDPREKSWSKYIRSFVISMGTSSRINGSFTYFRSKMDV